MDGILTLLRDPIWGFIGLIVGGITIPIVLWRLSRPSTPANPKNQNNATLPPTTPPQQQSPPQPQLETRTRIILFIILLVILVGSFILFWPLLQNPLSYSQTSIQWGSFNTWFWWFVSGFPAALCWVMFYDLDIDDIWADIWAVVVICVICPIGEGIFMCFVFCIILIGIFHFPVGFPIGIGAGVIFAFPGIFILSSLVNLFDLFDLF